MLQGSLAIARQTLVCRQKQRRLRCGEMRGGIPGTMCTGGCPGCTWGRQGATEPQRGSMRTARHLPSQAGALKASRRPLDSSTSSLVRPLPFTLCCLACRAVLPSAPRTLIAHVQSVEMGRGAGCTKVIWVWCLIINQVRHHMEPPHGTNPAITGRSLQCGMYDSKRLCMGTMPWNGEWRRVSVMRSQSPRELESGALQCPRIRTAYG